MQEREFRAAQARRVRVRWDRVHEAMAGEAVRRDGELVPMVLGSGAAELRFAVRRVPGRRRLEVLDGDGKGLGFWSEKRVGRVVTEFLEAFVPGWGGTDGTDGTDGTKGTKMIGDRA